MFDGGRLPRLSMPLALFAGAAIAILAGASLNIAGRTPESVLPALLVALLSFGAGIGFRWWKYALAVAIAGLVLNLWTYHFSLGSPALRISIAGELALVVGGMISFLAYTRVNGDIHRRMDDLERLNRRLEEQHRVFMAATDDATLVGGLSDLASTTARQTGAGVCCYFLLSGEATHFLPQEPAFGLGSLRPQPVDRRRQGDPLLAAIEANQEFFTTSARDLHSLFSLMPPDLRLEGALVVPIRMGDNVGGFVLLANKPGGFSQDDRRLAMTLAMRAGQHLASLHAVALSKREAERYALLNDLVKKASGLSFDEVLALVLQGCGQLVPHDSARIAIFGPNDSYTMSGGSPVPTPIAGSALASVRTGQSVIRGTVTPHDGLFSGLQVPEGNAVSEALVPIRGKQGALGAICLGRRKAGGFREHDLPALDELGTMAGVAVENAHQLEQVSGQANKLDTALNALGEISQALTSVTEGPAVLERKTLESAARLYGVRHALITRALDASKHRVSDAIGFGEGVVGAEIHNGQGVIGAAMLSGTPVAVTDLASAWEVQDSTLAAQGIRAALTVPMIQGKMFWGSLSVFDSHPRTWTDDDVRVLATLGNETVVAVRNAELYDSSKKMIWELSNLHEGLKTVTSTLELDQVLELVLDSAGKAAEAQIGCVALLEGGELRLAASHGTDHATAERLALGMGADICSDVLQAKKPVMEHMDDDQSGSGPLNPRSVLCVPIMLRDAPTGVIFLANYQAGRPFTEDHRRLVTALAAQAAISIDNAKLFKDRQDLFVASLKALASAVDARDPYTAGHSGRVTQYSLVIARQLDWEPHNRGAWRRLEQGGLLHDIGKIAVPDAVLAKPGRLTDAEFEIMKSHPLKGYEILKNLTMLTDELKIVRSHHERYDGKGYPDHLTGDQLPLFVWIVSAADAIDAMTSDRPYRKGMSFEVALAEVAKGSGTHFHPVVAEAVLAAARGGTLRVLAQQSMYADAPLAGAFENPVA
jgi:GAF domain-containing protein